MRYFLALAQERNFGRAAERLHMAQPPLTRQIRALEQDMGAQLFIRTAKGVDLTEAGEILLEEVPNLLALAQRAEERVLRSARGMSGRIDVGLFTSSVLDAIPVILARFHEQRPDVQIGLHTMNKPQQIDALLERRIDVGFNRLVPPTPGIAVEVISREGLMVALHKSHPLSSRAFLTLADLEDQPMILYPNLPMNGLAQHVEQAFKQEKRRLRIEQEAGDVLTCLALVSARFGLCITTTPASNLSLPGVVYLPLRARSLREVELNCLYRQDDNATLLQAFLAIVREVGSESAG